MFTLSNNLKSKDLWIDIAFYVALALVATSVATYGVLTFKVYFYNQKIAGINTQIASYGTPEEKAYEQKVFGYKKAVDDFALLINHHNISSNVFTFIEHNTLPQIWFSSFNMSEGTGDIRLAGQADTMETLSRQFKILEDNKDYIKKITLLNSQINTTQKVDFILNLTLASKIFTYQATP